MNQLTHVANLFLNWVDLLKLQEMRSKAATIARWKVNRITIHIYHGLWASNIAINKFMQPIQPAAQSKNNKEPCIWVQLSK